MWSTQMPGAFNLMHCSDGFFMNLLSVLLRLCKPFCEPGSTKLLKVQPTYCLATQGDPKQLSDRNVHAKGRFVFLLFAMDVFNAEAVIRLITVWHLN